MKRTSLWILILLGLLVILMGCNNQPEGINDPPQFVEMFLDPDSEIPEEVALPATANGILKLEETTTTETETTDTSTDTQSTDTTTESPEFDGEIYSEFDFEVVVVTNGANYDLLFSVELNDTLLGSCVYTNQSTLYHATSTVEVETDGSYTTTVRLTIPGTEAPETYLTERTISLSKILFTRDTADGTFPADIPTNTTTTLAFRIHAREYFDAQIGLPLRVNEDGLVDVILTPDSAFYDIAEAAAVSIVTLPATVNGYGIGSIILEDLSWVTELHLAGATDDVFILGDFAELTNLTFADFSFTVMTEFRHLTMSGVFSSLVSIELSAIDRYRFLMGQDTITGNAVYEAYLAAHLSVLNEFPLLETLQIDGSCLDLVRIGRDGQGISFPELTTVLVDDTLFGDFEIGEENNEFPALSSISIANSRFSTIRIKGTKPAENTGADFSMTMSNVDYTIYVEGSIIGSIAFHTSTIGGIEIRGGSVQASKFNSLTFSTSTIAGFGHIWIYDSHPLLSELYLHDLEVNELIIGDVGSVFASLTSITLEDISSSHVKIGDRDAEFPVLAHIVLTGVEATGYIWITAENADYSFLEDILVESVTAGDLMIANSTDDFSSLALIVVRDSTFTDELIIAGGGILTALETMVVQNVTCVSFTVYDSAYDYELYVDNLTASINFTLYASACTKIWLTEADVTAWAHYDYAHAAAISMETGTYVP